MNMMVGTMAMAARFSPAERLTIVTTVLALVHHVDHVLRVDNDGWPFRSEVTLFSYSFLVYGILAAVWHARGLPWLRVGTSATLALFVTLTHVWLDAPSAQYVTWAARPEANWLAASSPVLGVMSVALTFLVPVAAGMVFVAFVRSRGV